MPTAPALVTHRGLLGTDPAVVVGPAGGQGWNAGPSGHCREAWLGLVRGWARGESKRAHVEGEGTAWRAKHRGPGGHSHGIRARGLSRWAALMQGAWVTDILAQRRWHLEPTSGAPTGRQSSFVHVFVHSFHYL